MMLVDYTNAALDRLKEPEEEFWDKRPVLAHVRDFARARMSGPWSTLGVVLARAVASVPPDVALPAIVGGPMSLNLFFALVGPSGAGKGASESAACDAVEFVDNLGRLIDVPVLPLGSGEGISRTFRPAGTADDAGNHIDRALFSVPEIDTLSSLLGRQGSTLEGEIRKLYSGEALGFTNAQKATRSVVPAHSYRAALTVGVQPLRAEALFAGADGGTTQRFVWLDVRDPDAPDITPTAPEPLQVRAPAWNACTLEIPEVARYAIRRNRLAQLRGENVDPLNGHALLCRLKVAAALMILDGRSVVSEEDWTLAGEVMVFSNLTRTATQDALNARVAHANRARGLAVVEREEAENESRRSKARDAVLNVLHGQHGPELSASAIRKKVNTMHRSFLDDAFGDLVDAGHLVSIEVQGGTRYKLTEPA
ncbi:hypothetical protein [Nocardia sp. XZ_19_369]|uniref:hypothetical protein n=1 Tax=Nocardia sp. XZ_19_369 TaxID=2769487 RepID=UPI001E31E06E|nr:hypothetical protein [Nocardia sp. XZ_19_369]